jgi:hypothetical protein
VRALGKHFGAPGVYARFSFLVLFLTSAQNRRRTRCLISIKSNNLKLRQLPQDVSKSASTYKRHQFLHSIARDHDYASSSILLKCRVASTSVTFPPGRSLPARFLLIHYWIVFGLMLVLDTAQSKNDGVERVDLRNSVFSHAQLYVAYSLVTNVIKTSCTS